ncbi:hypothetical protein [Opitutus terrae]|uniref:Uncharacterized protein n=1 Tax=Opitutus terrae (strain DSM 11246 / JCM 15787 / PB90-1) TaxID=452637 RepID=B1ZQZ2_OPITP|nr:hypothetical protein [Opitutus terrae]ACB73659.1 hypothetical protein Oter_0369 [Opitutus terrae PB90-1]
MTAAPAKLLIIADDEPSRITLGKIVARSGPFPRVRPPWSFTAVSEAARCAVVA